MNSTRKIRPSRYLLLTVLVTFLIGMTAVEPVFAAPPPPTLSISQVPLTIVSPTHPQVLFAIGNSQSMDGSLSGAIMTGSGTLGSDYSSLTSSSSPVNYNVPPGFTAPVSGTVWPGTAAITVNNSGTLYDNSASRLNVAKAGVSAIIKAYAKTTDFALETYETTKPVRYKTWLYVMSPPGGFTFSDTNSSPPAGTRYLPNPCYNFDSASSEVEDNCEDIADDLYGDTELAKKYILVAKSSDDPDVNDVLYWTGDPAVTVAYGSRSKPNPYPPNFSLGNYNNGNIRMGYASATPSNGIKVTGPTNAGFVPYSAQVMYIRRGFGYYTTVTNNTGTMVVNMQSAGTNPTTATVQAVVNAFAPSLEPETNDEDSDEVKALAAQSPIAGLMKKANSYLATVPDPTGCAQQYVVLISDGLPTLDLSGDKWPPLGSASAAGYGVTATFNADGSLNTTNDQALTDAISQIAALKAAGIKTYVVGLGAGVDPTLNPVAASTLKAMAVAGGTGDYFAATSAAALVSDLNSILIKIQKGTMSSTSVAVNSGSLNTNTTVYQATFTVSDTPYQDWTGDLQAYAINPTTGLVSTTPTWSAKAQLTAQTGGALGWKTGRTIATWNPSSSKGVPFDWSNLTAAQQADLTVAGDPVPVAPNPSKAELRFRYLRGDQSNELHNGGPFRDRSGLLGDVVDSNPVYVGQPAGPYLDASYATFRQSFLTTPRPDVLYFGANDGMLHAIDASSGRELFAFVPNAVFPNLARLPSTFYNGQHHFFVDGQPSISDVMFGSDGQWHTELVGGEGAGGRSIYALDVTSPQSFTSETALANAVLWEFTDADMGLTFSKPIIVRLNANPVTDASTSQTVAGFAVLFGNGYNSPAGKPFFYAVKAETGQVIAKIDLCTATGVPAGACDPTKPNGLSSVVAANANGILGFPVDEVYAGDLQGNLWAIDVTDADPANWTVRLIFQARDSSGNMQPITTAPVLTLNPNFPGSQGLMVTFGTGQLLEATDVTDTSVQSFYAVWDDGSSTPALRADLEQQTITLEAAATTGLPQDVRTTSNNTVDWSAQRGWYYDLPISGERVLTPAVVEEGGIVFTTYAPRQPSALQCTAGGVSWLMDVAYENGGAFARPELDVAGTGDLNGANQQVGNKNPVGMRLGNGFIPTPSIIRANLPGSAKRLKLVNGTSATGKPIVKSIKERGHGPSPVGWWPVN